MSNIVEFIKKHRIELSVILLLLLIPILEPIFEVLVECLFTMGQYVGSWVRTIGTGGFCK